MSNKHYSAFEITEKGLALRQMAIAKGLKVDFTRGAIGEGRPSGDLEPYFMTELVSHAADVPIKESYAQEKNHIMTIVIDGTALQNDVMMTEMGIYARLIDTETDQEIMPEIVYGYTYTSKYDYVPAGEEYNLYREISFDTVLSRDGKLKIVYDKTKVYVTRQELEEYGAQIIKYKNELSGLLASDLQGAIDELKALCDKNPKVHVSEIAPENWAAGDWWYQTIWSRDCETLEPGVIQEVLNTQPDGQDVVDYVRVDDISEPITNAETGSLIIKLEE